MKTLIRVLMSSVGLVATFYFVFWIPGSLVPLFGELRWLAVVVSLVSGIGVAWFVWTKTGTLPSTSVALCAGLGAALVGGTAFCLGFFGPIILAPEANQGPCLGFILGPLGIVVGALGGFLSARSAKLLSLIHI